MTHPHILQPSPNHPQRSKRAAQKGIVAVEIAYAFPFLLLVFMVMLFLSDLMLVRHHLNVSLNQAARVCAYKESRIQAASCVTASLDQQLTDAGISGRCNIVGNVDVVDQGDLYLSSASCEYNGFAPVQAIFDLSGGTIDDLAELRFVSVTAPFPKRL